MSKYISHYLSTAMIAAALMITLPSLTPANAQSASRPQAAAPGPTLAPPPATPASPDRPWTAPAALVGQLAAPVKFGDYSVRPPTGYKQLNRPSPDGFGQLYYWSGVKRADGTTPALSVIVAAPPKGHEHDFTQDQVLMNLVTNFRADRVNWTMSNIQHGMVNGLPFERVYWSGSDTAKGQNLRGFDYITQLADGTFVLLVSEDVDPASQTSLQLIEASALTFKSNVPAAAAH